MFKVLGGIGRSVPLYNGKARILVKAIIPVASSYLADMQSVCEANGWKSVLDERGNLVVLSVVSIDAYRLSDSTLMTAYLHFAETAAQNGLQKSVFGRWCCVLRCSRIRRLTL